jgi:hypothetical protein
MRMRVVDLRLLGMESAAEFVGGHDAGGRVVNLQGGVVQAVTLM